MHQNRRVCLLNPGPVTLTERVRQSQLRPDLCHREREFSELQADVRRRLAGVYEETSTAYTAVLLTGSGTAAVEAMVGSLVPHNRKALVVANGVYGERIASIMKIHGKQFHVVQTAWTEPMNLNEVQRRLDEDNSFTHVIAVHHETTTGRLNEMTSLGGICRRHNVALLLDAVSSFGGEWIDFEAWNVEAAAATANKCLHGVPGMAFVLAKKDVFQTRSSESNSLYLDLFSNFEAQSSGCPQSTPAVQALYALQEALIELEEFGGWKRRHEHYRTLSDVVRSRLLEQGLQLLLDNERLYSSILTSFDLPPGIDFDSLYHPLKEAGFVIYPGQKSLKSTIFRVAVMGDLSPNDMNDFADALADVISSVSLQNDKPNRNRIDRDKHDRFSISK